MKYMLLIYNDPAEAPEVAPEDMEADMGKWFAYTDALAQAGALVGGEPLQGIETATTVRVRDGKRIVTDGPFAETREHLGGYYLIECADLDAALGWAERLPSAPYGSVEVRPLMEIPGMSS